jgi:hypothetical protein
MSRRDSHQHSSKYSRKRTENCTNFEADNEVSLMERSRPIASRTELFFCVAYIFIGLKSVQVS